MTRLLSGQETRGTLPHVGPDFIDQIDRDKLVGRGGAAFPTAMKWGAVADRSRGNAVIVVNGAEGEPRSLKDRHLMTERPHAVLDGAFIAARVLRANRVILYIGERHDGARASMLRALGERDEPESRRVSVASAPARYVAGAETAAVHFLNDGVATPTTIPPYPFEHGVGGTPTLVQNVETLARIGLIARGTPADTVLVTAAGSVSRPGVVEVESRTRIGEAIRAAGGLRNAPRGAGGRLFRDLVRTPGCVAAPARPQRRTRLRRDRCSALEPLSRLRDRGHHALPRRREFGAVRALLLRPAGAGRSMHADRRRQVRRS